MKKLLLSLLFLPFAAWAQPNLVYAPLNIGDSVTLHDFEYPVPSFAKSGNNNWDFSALPTSAAVIGVKLVNPATTPNAADFPTATICQKVSAMGLDIYLYAIGNSDSLWTLGSRAPAMPLLDETFIDPDVAYRFPFSLNQSQFDRSENTNGDIDSSIKKYVGWGNINTPYGNYNNVIMYEDIRYNPISNVWEVQDYNWISVATMWDVAEIDRGDSSGTWYNNHSATTATEDFLTEKYQLSTYPNPSSDNANISFVLPTATEIKIQLIAVDGSSIRTLLSEKRNAGKHIVSIPVNELASGTYFVRSIFDNSPVVKTISIVK